jgi:predicted metalloendopeptidase
MHSSARTSKYAHASYGTTLSGVTEMQPRWKRAVGAVVASQGESLGKLYVEQHFPAERKVRMEAMVKNLLAAYKQRIDTLDWMNPETKKEAQAKLVNFTPKIGYLNRWKDYSGLVVKRDDLVWRMKMREPQQIVQVKTDPHSLGEFRANGTMMSQPAFSEAFNIKPGDTMYLALKDRVIIW